MKHLDVHFLNVGHGDCTFIDHPSGNLTMIDMNNSKSLPNEDFSALAARMNMALERFVRKNIFGLRSPAEKFEARLAQPYEYYRSKFLGRRIHRYIQTHPDMDHMSGLWRMFWIEKTPVTNFWDTRNSKVFRKSEFENGIFEWNDWLTYCQMKDGKLPNDQNVSSGRHFAGDAGPWVDDGITILSPTVTLAKECDRLGHWNNVSYVLRIEYGGRVVILPGDAEEAAWESVVTREGSSALKCDVLKAAHHGRDSGFSPEAVKLMSPTIVVCSVGESPNTDAAARYAKAGAKVVSTRYHGTMRLRIWKSGRLELKGDGGKLIARMAPLKSWAELYWY